MKYIRIFSVIVITVLFISCSKINGEGDVVSETRDVTGYTSVTLDMDGTVNYIQDSAYALVIRGQQNILDRIETVVVNNKLEIRYKKNVIIGFHEPIVVEVNAPDVSTLSIDGSGQINMFDMWETYSCDLNVSGSGDINLASVYAHDISANISGSGNINVAWGLASYEDLNISGSGTIDMLEVEADTVYASISASGNILVWAVKYLNATISGSGNIKYKGNPVLDSHISGSGNVIHLP